MKRDYTLNVRFVVSGIGVFYTIGLFNDEWLNFN